MQNDFNCRTGASQWRWRLRGHLQWERDGGSCLSLPISGARIDGRRDENSAVVLPSVQRAVLFFGRSVRIIDENGTSTSHAWDVSTRALRTILTAQVASLHRSWLADSFRTIFLLTIPYDQLFSGFYPCNSSTWITFFFCGYMIVSHFEYMRW